MAEHPNVARIRDGYAAFAKGDFAILNELFAEDLVWHVGGRNQLTKDYRGRDEVYGFFGRLLELTEGSFHLDLHTVFADDEHGVALVATSASRGGKSVRINEAHVYHLRDGKVTEFWDASTDEYALDELIGGQPGDQLSLSRSAAALACGWPAWAAAVRSASALSSAPSSTAMPVRYSQKIRITTPASAPYVLPYEPNSLT